MSEQPADEELPEAADAYWDDRTTEALRYLREARGGYLRERTRAAAYVVYVGVLAALVYVVPYVLAALRAPDVDVPDPRTRAVVAAATASIVLLVLVAMVRDALWRGPALLDRASATWLLAAPVRRGPLLRPRFRRSLMVAGVAGTAVGAGTGAIARLLVGGDGAVFTGFGAATGLVTMLLGVGLGGLVESAPPRVIALLCRIGSGLWLLPLLPAIALIGPGAGSAPSGSAKVASAVLAVAAVAAAGAAIAADRRIDRVPGRVLRIRAATVSDVAQSLGTLQPRRARLIVDLAQGRRPARFRRLPLPRHRLLLWPWRDAVTLLRAPARLLWGIGWVSVAGQSMIAAGRLTVTAAPGGVPAERFALTLAALVAGYLGAAQLVEAARLDADDPRLVRSLPERAATVASAHLVTPLAVILATLVPAMVWALVRGPASAPASLVTFAMAAPALVGAALVSAYRGEVPPGLIVGVSGPTGDTGPLQAVLWYLRGPLTVIALLSPLALALPAAPTCGVTAVIVIGWAAARARKVL